MNKTTLKYSKDEKKWSKVEKKTFDINYENDYISGGSGFPYFLNQNFNFVLKLIRKSINLY